MKTIIIACILLLADISLAADNKIIILSTASVPVTTSINGSSQTYVGEIKVMCIAGYKWVLFRAGGSDSSPVLAQMFYNNFPIDCTR